MRTPEQWWTATKNDPGKLTSWLRQQFHGENGAAQRIRAFTDQFANDFTPIELATLERIAYEEERHALWVGGLLTARGIEPGEQKPDRYWSEVAPQADSARNGAAVGAHAELMRLERIRVIAADEQAPSDIRETFQRILVDEEGHALAFSRMAGAVAMANTSAAHANGLAALGLVL